MDIPFLSTKEAANTLGVSDQRIRTLLRDETLEGQQVGKTWVVDPASVEKYLRKQAQETPLDRPSKAKHTGIKALSFFSGAMGLDLGLEKAGIEIALSCEVDKRCRQTILANRPDIALIGDIAAYSPAEVLEYSGVKAGEVDIIVGGPPCQAFSTAGSRRAFNDARGNVFLNYIDLILSVQPKYAVIENVRGLLSAPLNHRPHIERGKDKTPLQGDEKPGGALAYIIQQLREGGYSISFNLYNAANYGVPQVRERVVMICSRDGSKVPYMNPTHSDNPEFGLPSWRTLQDVIGDLDPAQARHIDFPEKRLFYYRMLKSDQYWKHLPTELQKQALGKSYYSGGGKTGFLRRLAWDKPSCTLVTHPAMPATDICHPAEHRPLSIQEYKRIQQFPDDWEVCGSLIDQYRQIGNAVPVGLGEAIGRTILAHMEGKTAHPPLNFPYSRYKNTDDVLWERDTKKKLRDDAPIEDLFSAFNAV